MSIRSRHTVALGILAAMLGLSAIAGSSALAGGQPPSRPAEGKQPEGRPQEGRQPPGGRQGGDRQGGAPSVEAGMKGMNRALRQLKDQIADASKKDENLRLIGDMQRGCVSAKNAQPRKFQDIKNEAERAKATEKFRRDLIALTRKLLEIEVDIMDGKIDVAKTSLAEVMKIKEDAHKALGIEED